MDILKNITIKTVFLRLPNHKVIFIIIFFFSIIDMLQKYKKICIYTLHNIIAIIAFVGL